MSRPVPDAAMTAGVQVACIGAGYWGKNLVRNFNAQGGNYLHNQIADVTVSFLSFPSGVRAHVFVSWLHPFKEQKLIVVGDRQMAVFDDVEEKEKLLLYPHSIGWKNHVPIPNRAQAQPIAFDWEEPLRAECTVVCGVTIGQYAFIGAGAVVLKDVPDYALVVGNPGRVAGWMCVCGNRIDFEGEEGQGRCRDCGQAYRKLGQRVSLQ